MIEAISQYRADDSQNNDMTFILIHWKSQIEASKHPPPIVDLTKPDTTVTETGNAREITQATNNYNFSTLAEDSQRRQELLYHEETFVSQNEAKNPDDDDSNSEAA